MPSGCSIRALWIINNQDTVVFSRRFPVVEKQWCSAYKTENENTGLDLPRLPTDQQISDSFTRRKRREGSTRGYGIRVAQSTKGSDSWVDDPITRHIISLCLTEEDDDDDDERNILWPIALHTKALYSILVLPLVEPKEMKDYVKLCRRSDCGPAVGEDLSLSSLLLNISSITGYL
jgi:AP-5 complex subunit mu-1